MNQIILSSEQAALLETAQGRVPLLRADGTVVGFVVSTTNATTPREPIFTPEEIAQAASEAMANEPGITTDRLLERLRRGESPR